MDDEFALCWNNFQVGNARFNNFAYFAVNGTHKQENTVSATHMHTNCLFIFVYSICTTTQQAVFIAQFS